MSEQRVSDEMLDRRITLQAEEPWAHAGVDIDIAFDLRDCRAALAAATQARDAAIEEQASRYTAWRDDHERLEASAAVLREALEAIPQAWARSDDMDSRLVIERMVKIARNALTSTTAGASLLAELERLRRVAEAARAWRDEGDGMAGGEPWVSRLVAPARPKIVCLCGSTRFMDWFHEAGWQETMAGKIVLSVGVSKHLPADHGGEAMGPEVAAALDELHLRKIDLADEVFVLNVGGYIGESTRREIDYAIRHRKPIRYLEPAPAEGETK